MNAQVRTKQAVGAEQLFGHLNAGPLKKKGSNRSRAGRGRCPRASSPGQGDAPRPAPHPAGSTALRGLRTQGTAEERADKGAFKKRQNKLL